MNKIRNIVRLVLGIFTMVAAISILAAFIYFFQDYELNVTLNTIFKNFIMKTKKVIRFISYNHFCKKLLFVNHV